MHGTPLEMAAAAGHAETLRLLVNHGGDVKVRNPTLVSAIFLKFPNLKWFGRVSETISMLGLSNTHRIVSVK
jgi:ankyrin repeat protein